MSKKKGMKPRSITRDEWVMVKLLREHLGRLTAESKQCFTGVQVIATAMHLDSRVEGKNQVGMRVARSTFELDSTPSGSGLEAVMFRAMMSSAEFARNNLEGVCKEKLAAFGMEVDDVRASNFHGSDVDTVQAVLESEIAKGDGRLN